MVALHMPITYLGRLLQIVCLVFALLPGTALGKERNLPSLEGDWILIGYHMNNGKRFIEVPVNEPAPGDKPERWRFRKDGTFLHLMDEKLGFSGNYSIVPMDIPLQQASTLREGNSFLVVTTDVVVTIPGMAERKVEYFHGIQKDDRIVLFYLGNSTNPNNPPTQGHTFRKSWKGGWTW